MSEPEWLSSHDPQTLLSLLEGKASERKLRLFACAAVRRFWTVLRNPQIRSVVEVSARYAEGEASGAELTEARQQAEWAAMSAPLFEAGAYAAALAASEESAIEAARNVVLAAQRQAWDDAAYEGLPGRDERDAGEQGREAERVAQCALLRYHFGNPYRPQRFDPGWLRWADGTLPKMARVIHDNNQFEDLQFLADALIDAGCEDEELLRQCRPPTQHDRGFWVLDALLRLT
jgi:hypothetical protein